MIAPMLGIIRGVRSAGSLPLAIVLFAFCLLMPARVGAQDPATASLRGAVTDGATGTPLEGAEVVISGPKMVTIWSDAQGAWRAAGLLPGRYRVRSRRIGYAAREFTIDLRAGDDVQRRIALVAVPRSLDEVVVTAARREQALKDVAVTTEVVTRREIEQTGASDLASILTEQLGIELQGGHPAGAGIMLQGLGSERVLVLLDGQPVAGRISGVFDVSRIPSSVIERVEVVKGPQSTLYGSEAMGGVVNIITRSPLAHTLGASASVSAGTQGRLEGTAGLIAGRGAWSSALNASRRESELTPGRGSENGALASRTDVAAKLLWSPDSAISLEASLLALDERQRWMSGTYFNFGDNSQVSGRLTGSWQRGRHRLVPTLYASVFDHLSRASTEPLPIAGDTGQRQLQRLFEAELLYNTQLGAAGAHALDLGVELRRDDTRSDNVPGGRRALMTVEPFAQLELRAAAVSIVPGVRMSWSEQWGTHVTPRLALRYELSDAVTLRASAGSGFRAPDFKELYMFFQNQSAGYAVQGNLDLRPESSRNLTTGIEWAGDRVYLRGQLFQNDFRDFIETRPINAPGEAPLYRYVNVDDGWTRGAELESGLSLGRLRMEAGYSRLATRDRATGKSLLGRPEQSGRIGANYMLPSGLRLSVTAIHTGLTPMRRNVAVVKSTQPQSVTLVPAGVLTSWRDGFTRADVRIAHRIPGGLQLAIGADNVFDQRPAEWAGFSGRQLYTTLTWNFERSDAPED
jgi:outer membrane receptor for ferrienterochelin and colicins